MRIALATAMLLASVSLGLCAELPFSRQVYSCYTSGMTFQELANGGVTYVSHVPATRETAREAHRWGIRTMPYVSLYKVVDSSEAPEYATEPFWKEIDLVNFEVTAGFNHDQDGTPKFVREDVPYVFEPFMPPPTPKGKKGKANAKKGKGA